MRIGFSPTESWSEYTRKSAPRVGFTRGLLGSAGAKEIEREIALYAPESHGPKIGTDPQDWAWSSWSFYAKGEQGLIRIDELTPKARVVQKPPAPRFHDQSRATRPPAG